MLFQDGQLSCGEEPRNVDLIIRVSLTETSGAVYRGLEGNQIENRKAPGHYGIKFRTGYEGLGRATNQERYWCPFEEEWKVGNQMEWFINKV